LSLTTGIVVLQVTVTSTGKFTAVGVWPALHMGPSGSPCVLIPAAAPTTPGPPASTAQTNSAPAEKAAAQHKLPAGEQSTCPTPGQIAQQADEGLHHEAERSLTAVATPSAGHVSASAALRSAPAADGVDKAGGQEFAAAASLQAAADEAAGGDEAPASGPTPAATGVAGEVVLSKTMRAGVAYMEPFGVEADHQVRTAR
jgi:hypothetical protein